MPARKTPLAATRPAVCRVASEKRKFDLPLLGVGSGPNDDILEKLVFGAPAQSLFHSIGGAKSDRTDMSPHLSFGCCKSPNTMRREEWGKLGNNQKLDYLFN